MLASSVIVSIVSLVCTFFLGLHFSIRSKCCCGSSVDVIDTGNQSIEVDITTSTNEDYKTVISASGISCDVVDASVPPLKSGPSNIT